MDQLMLDERYPRFGVAGVATLLGQVWINLPADDHQQLN